MKCGNLSKWSNISGCKNLLFFSQLVNELLFDYSIPSNRISTLNSHFLCYDAISAITGIDNHGVPEGTLKPILEELYLSLQKDPAYKDSADSPLKYFSKYQNDKYRISTNVSELNFEEAKNAVLAISSRFFKDRQYYELLKVKIVQIIINNIEEDQPVSFRLIKSLLTEIVNLGYSIKYIQSIMTNLFWNPSRYITSPEVINEFFSYFTFIEKEFKVVFIVPKRKFARLVSYDDLILVDELSKETARHTETNFLNIKNDQSFLTLQINALDQYDAAAKAKRKLTTKIAFYRLYDHDFRYNISSAKCGVYGNNDFFIIDKELNPVAHTKTPSIRQLQESMEVAQEALNAIKTSDSVTDYYSLIHAALFHSHALDSTSLENQLLDQWAIIEAILDISNKHTSDRINQVCMQIIPILKRKYIYSLLLQLSNDIKVFSEAHYFEIVSADDSEAEVVRKVCEFIILDEHKEERERFLETCNNFPLLRERIEYYSITLATPQKVFQFVEKHAERVKWQIMRIYRNRNLIIHNGDSMAYLGLLIENHHSYVDDFLSYVIHCFSNEHDVNSMRLHLFAKECEWNADFASRKGEMNSTVIEKILKQ